MNNGQRIRSKYYIVKAIEAEFRTKSEAEKYLEEHSSKLKVIRGLEKPTKIHTAEKVIIKTRKEDSE